RSLQFSGNRWRTQKGRAERGGFEPPAPVLPVQLLSRQPCSATPAPLRGRHEAAPVKRSLFIIGEASPINHSRPIEGGPIRRDRIRGMSKREPWIFGLT